MNEILIVFLLFLTGLGSGFMNTVASSGTALTLPVMIFLGIPPSVANATNRLPLLLGFVMATYTFHKHRNIDWIQAKKLIIPVIVGTILGCSVIGRVGEHFIRYILITALIISVILILLKPASLIAVRRGSPREVTMISLLLMLGVGIWGGLIVLDIGTFILFALVLYQNNDIQKANGLKAVLVLAIGIISTLYFGFNDMINWEYGILLSAGSVLGSYIGSKFAMQLRSRVWIYRIILGIIIVELATLAVKEFSM
jgi:uncharacterized membrane protein YfcA